MTTNFEDDFSLRDYARNIGIGIAIVLTMVAAYKFIPRSTFAADGSNANWDATVNLSRASRQPALVLFTANWCPACRALHENVLSRPDVQDQISRHYLMVTVDLSGHNQANTERAQKYGVSGIPTLIRFDADGKETARCHYKSPEDMLAWLEKGEEATQ